jgi:hypothetical protein
MVETLVFRIHTERVLDVTEQSCAGELAPNPDPIGRGHGTWGQRLHAWDRSAGIERGMPAGYFVIFAE